MSETPNFENVPEHIRPYVAEIDAKALDLIRNHPELRGIPADKIVTIFQAGIMAGFEAAMKIDEDHS